MLRNLQQILQIGQILHARVLTGSNQAGDTVQLRLAGEKLELPLPVPVRAGENLRMQVIALNPRLEMALLREPPPPPNPPPPSLSQHFRQWVPQQAGQAPLLATLHHLNQPANTGYTRPPDNVLQAVQRLWQAMPTIAQITTSEGLRQSLLNSGIFYEARLARLPDGQRPEIAQDLKARLMSLAEQLRAQPLPPPGNTSRTGTLQLPGTPLRSGVAQLPEHPPPMPNSPPTPQARTPVTPMMHLPMLLEGLRHQVERSLARLVIHQLSSSERAEETPNPRWLLELALRGEQGADIIHLRLEREARRGQQETGDEQAWKAELAMDLPELGPLHVRIVVKGDSVSTHFWVKSEEVRLRLADALPQLQKNLESRQLQVTILNCRTGTPPDPKRPDEDQPNGPWIDSHA
ncbi:flagellar hook-length control protein FliK [Ectothiorhodospira shaposhnikovii]|uniref:flagellar hook-length control protein FliK n=1 Tax=Ectothiorhodospira shaposhnikovii TaxID=1054 RepID=UPI0019034BD5